MVSRRCVFSHIRLLCCGIPSRMEFDDPPHKYSSIINASPSLHPIPPPPASSPPRYFESSWTTISQTSTTRLRVTRRREYSAYRMLTLLIARVYAASSLTFAHRTNMMGRYHQCPRPRSLPIACRHLLPLRCSIPPPIWTWIFNVS